ncbi:MAG: efflux RND transporter periplasmic adaptor subunit [Fluviicola sp.]
MKKSIIVGAVAVVLLVIALLVIFNSSDEATPAQTEEHHEETESGIKEVALNEAQYNASEIELGTFSSKNLSEVIHANGYTKLPPQNQADVTVLVEGTIKSIQVIEGQFVKEGQTLATIESLEFTKLQQAYLESKSNLEWLSEEYDRQKTLSSENVNAKKTLQKSKSDYESEKARNASLKKQLNILHLQGEGAAISIMAIKAPISGYITEINLKIGSTAKLGEPLFSIVDNSKMHVDLLVYEKDLQKVKPGQQVRFTLTNQDNTEIMGKIFSIGKAFENETKSIAVHADILNEKQLLIPGMYVNALIDVGLNEVKALPEDAIVKADGREFIFILEKIEEEKGHDEKAGHDHEDDHEHSGKAGKGYHFQRIEVKTGTRQLGFVQITLLQEIPANAKLVLQGAYYIQSHLLKSEGGGGHEH